MDYKVLADCLAEVKTNPATKGLITTDYDPYLSNQLEISAGKTAGGETLYRPYYVAAKFLEQFRSQQSISKADGAEFTGLALPIASLLGLQASLDKSLGLTVPSGFEAISVSETTPGMTQRRSTRSYTPQARP